MGKALVSLAGQIRFRAVVSFDNSPSTRSLNVWRRLAMLLSILAVCVHCTSNGALDKQKTTDRSLNLSEDFLIELQNSCGISFSDDMLPTIVELGTDEFDEKLPDTLFREYLLYRFLGFVATNFETYADFYRERAAERAGYYDPQARAIYLHSHVDPFWTDQVLAHELAHVWLDDALRHRDRRLPLSIADAPDSYLTLAAVSEGFAHTCQLQYATERVLAQRDLPTRGAGRTSDNTMPLDNRPVDQSHALAPFFERASGWTYSIGRAYVQDRLQMNDPASIIALARRDDWPQNTSELMGYQVGPSDRQLGGLLTREALIWSGIAWDNADAISASITLDELEIEAGGPSDEWCVTLSIELGQMEPVRPRFLGARQAFRRWASLTGNGVVEEGRDRMVIRKCSSSDKLDAEAQTRTAHMARFESTLSGDEARSVGSDEPTMKAPKHNYSPLPYASTVSWSSDGRDPAGYSGAGRLIPPSAHFGTDIDSLLEVVVEVPELRQHVGDVLESLLQWPERLVQVGARETTVESWEQQLRDAYASLESIASGYDGSRIRDERGNSEQL